MQADTAENKFIELVREHERLIYKVCSIYATDADDKKDLYQDIVLQAWRAWPKFRAESKISTWLYRIALNTAIGRNRKPTVRPHYEESVLLHIADPIDGRDQEVYKQLHLAIGKLSELDRALILLYLEDRPYQEIAEIMGITAGNVATRLTRIRDKMKKMMVNNKKEKRWI